jgi:predicted deacylase
MLFSAVAALALNFNAYHSQAQINQALHDAAAQNPALVTFHQLGASEQGRELDYVVIATDPKLPAIYLNGTHHGDEPSSTETVLGTLSYLLDHRDDADVKSLLAHYRVFLQPLVNADGHAANTREDPEGRDPNRDYSYPERSDADSFDIGFIKLVKDLVDKEHFRAAIAFHSGEEGVLWPWCYTNAPTRDADTFYTLSKTAANAAGMDYFVQSYDDYATEGEFTDYAYWKTGTLAVTMEVSNAKRPNERDLPDVVANAVRGTVAFMEAVEAFDGQRLVLRTAPPAAASFLNKRAVIAGRRLE